MNEWMTLASHRGMKFFGVDRMPSKGHAGRGGPASKSDHFFLPMRHLGNCTLIWKKMCFALYIVYLKSD